MIFPLKYKIKNPTHGETRQIRRFAWLPLIIDDKERGACKVWLGFYDVLQVYHVKQYAIKIGEENKAARVGNWIDISQAL